MNKKILILFVVVLLIFPLAKALSSCNEKCIKSGYALGSCKEICDRAKNEISVGQTDDCFEVGAATLIIGTDALESFSDDNPYIDEDSVDPDWVWVISGLTTKNVITDISNTADATQHSGPVIGIRNDFVADNIDEYDEKAKTVNGEYCLPNDYICVKYNSSTVSATDYGTYKIEYSLVDLSSFNSSWSSKPSILIKSYDKEDGLRTQRANYDVANISADVTTDKIWIVYNNTATYVAIFYEDTANRKQLAGYVQMSNDDVNIADINFYNTKDNDVQIDLRGNIASADNLNITLDISGNEGSVKNTDGIDDLVIWLSHAADGNFDGIGKTPSTSEASELMWGSSSLQIGEKDEDHLSLYGIQILNPKSNGASDQVVLEIPKDQVKAEIVVSGISTKTATERERTLITGEKAPSLALASEVADLKAQHLIFVGGPCANPLVEKIPEFPTCKDWKYEPGEAILQITAIGNKIALLVAGTTAKDTQKASFVLKNHNDFKENLKGKIVKVTGTDLEIEKIKVEALTKFTTKLDLSDYPVPFVEAGKFGNMLVVIGDKALAKDTVGASYIISGLMSVTRKATAVNETTEETTVTDFVADKIPLGNSLGEAAFFNNPLENLQSLQDTEINFKGTAYDVKDVVMFYNNGPSIQTGLSSGIDDYGTDAYMELEQGRLRYYYSFDQKIDLTTANADEPVKIKFLDRYFRITSIKSATEFESQIATEYVMKIGESVNIEGKKVTLVNVGTGDSVIMQVNETREIIGHGQRNTINGVEIENQQTFYEAVQNCCCFDLLSYLK